MTKPPETGHKDPASPRSGTVGRILQNAGWLLAGKGFGALLSLVYLAIVTRSLGAVDFGQFALILGTAQTLVALVGFQTWQLVVRYGMSHLQEGRPEQLRELLGFALTLDIVGAALGCLLAYAGIGALGKFFGWSPELQSQAFLFAVAILLSIRSTALGILRLHDRFKTAAAADAVMPIMRFAGALTVLLAGPTLAGFLLAWALAEAVTALTCWLLAAKAAATSVRPAGPVRARKVLREHPGLAAFAGSTNVSFTLEAVSKQFSVVLVGIAAGPVAAGHYRIAYQVGQGLAKLSELLSRAVYAELTRVLFGELRDRLGKLFWSSVRLSAIASLAIVGILFLAGKPALLLVAGNAFEPAYPLLLLLGMAAALDFAGVNFQPALLATGKATLMLKLRLFVTASLLAALFLLLPRYGATGAAMATLTSSMIGLLLFGVAAWRAVRSA